jgi:hypothetical protein
MLRERPRALRDQQQALDDLYRQGAESLPLRSGDRA